MRLKKQNELESLLKATETPRLKNNDTLCPDWNAEQSYLSKKAAMKLSRFKFRPIEPKSPSFLEHI